MGKVGTEKTLQKCADLLGVLVKGQVSTFDDFRQIKQIVQNGIAPEVFKIGDQIPLQWNDENGHTYNAPFDIVAFGNWKRHRDGLTVPGMVLQSHWLFPGVQFDGNEAFYVVTDNVLPAGRYYVTMGENWGNNVVKDKSYYFDLAADVPVGGQLLFGTALSTTGALPDQNPSNWRVYVYASATTLTETEKVSLTEGADGTSLGTLLSSTKYGTSGINNLHRSAYGYGRYGQSGICQYLNSDAAVESWWSPQNPYDRAPLELSSKRGFMAGFDSDFLDILEEVEVTTALNAKSDTDIGTQESVWNTFFLPSLEQEYCVPQLAGVEGSYWQYWKDRLGISSPQEIGSANALPGHIRYSIEDHSSPQNVRLRSAHRGYAYYTWFVGSSGYVTNSGSTHSLRFAPACVIC